MLKIFNSSEKKYFQKCLEFGVECVCRGGAGKEEKLELVGTLWQNVVNIVIGNLWKGLTLFTLSPEE